MSKYGVTLETFRAALKEALTQAYVLVSEEEKGSSTEDLAGQIAQRLEWDLAEVDREMEALRRHERVSQ